MRRTPWVAGIAIVGVAACFQGMGDHFILSVDDPAIQYGSRPLKDPVFELNRKVQAGNKRLKFESSSGYLHSVLDALDVPIQSQLAVFSKTSLQKEYISPYTPRAMYFGDAVVVAWMRGGFIELAAHDPQQGVNFYTLEQIQKDKPAFRHEGGRCLSCHVGELTLGVPGMLVRSTYTSPEGNPMLIYGSSAADHRSPLAERWGGWYVTGDPGPNLHLGNAMISETGQPESIVTKETLRQDSLRGKIDQSAYLSPYSDIAALMVFDHQMHMINLLTRVGWEIRIGFYQKQTPNLLLTVAPDRRRNLSTLLMETVSELVDYMLFVEEAPLLGKMRSTSGFADTFAAKGPHDSKGRSLRDLDLSHRLMRYPCSYMIYSEAFDNLPLEAKSATYQRVWKILSGAERGSKYARLTVVDRRAVLEILRETKKDLPDYFQQVSSER